MIKACCGHGGTFGRMNIKVGSELCDEEYRVITFRPEWNFIFLVGKDRTLITYDMDRKNVHVSHARVIHFCRSRGRYHMNRPYYLPYVPLFMDMESLAEQQRCTSCISSSQQSLFR
jgi:hypothetical protein